MGHMFAELAFTPNVRAAQECLGSRHAYVRLERDADTHDLLGPAEIAFIGRCESFYVATVGETGWPYVQHRGGPPGFLRVLDAVTLGFADFGGNRQYISVGNLAGNDRTSLFLMDYRRRRRLKILGRARIVAPDDAVVLSRLAPPDYRARIERGIIIAIEAFDWNCPQHIPQLVDARDVERELMALRDRVASLETELAAPRSRHT